MHEKCSHSKLILAHVEFVPAQLLFVVRAENGLHMLKREGVSPSIFTLNSKEFLVRTILS